VRTLTSIPLPSPSTLGVPGGCRRSPAERETQPGPLHVPSRRGELRQAAIQPGGETAGEWYDLLNNYVDFSTSL